MGSLPGAGEGVSPAPHEETPNIPKGSQVALWCWKGHAASVGPLKEEHPPMALGSCSSPAPSKQHLCDGKTFSHNNYGKSLLGKEELMESQG